MVTRPVSTISGRWPSSGWKRRGGRLAALIALRSRAEIVFTSGGTEADNLAMLGVVRAAARPPAHVITTAIEHPAVLNAVRPTGARGRRGDVCCRWAPSGIVDPDDVRRALRPDTVLVSIMHANNELGTVQPIAEIARIAREAGVLSACGWRAGAGQDSGGRGRAGRGSLQHERAQDLCAQGRRRAVRAQGDAARRRFRSAAITSATAGRARKMFRARWRWARGRAGRRATWRPSASGLAALRDRLEAASCDAFRTPA